MVPVPGLAHVALQQPHFAPPLAATFPPTSSSSLSSSSASSLLVVPPSQPHTPSPSSTPLDRRQIATCIGNLVALALNLIGALEKLFYEFDVKHPLHGAACATTNGHIDDRGSKFGASQGDHEEERLRSAAVLARVELLQKGLITVDEHIRELLRDLTFVDEDLNRKIELVRERASASAR
ncbi:MAG: hypothetical protein INR71_10305 [Terriglobus roseus]|nr:hypothetical protein [Terriglobus roseus]